MSRLTPSHEQSRFFSLYEFSQESTGWIGPLIVASVTQSGGGSGTVFARTSVFTCLVELGVAVLLLMPIDMKRGEARRDGVDVDVRQAAGGDDTKKPPSAVVGLDGVVVGASAAGPGATKPYVLYQENSSPF